MIITIPMFLNLSIIYFYYSTQENAEIKNIIFYSATSVIYIFCHILYLIKMINLEITIFDFFVVFCLFIIVIIHIEMIFHDFNVRIKHYPIINISLFIDLSILSLFFYLFYISEENKNNGINKEDNHKYGNQ